MTSAGAYQSSRRDDYGSCNSQLCTSYLVGLLACVLVVGGVFLAFHRWDYMWLAVSAVGVLLILVGSVLHFCGDRNNRRRSKCKRTVRPDLGHGEQLLPSAPTLSNAYSVSQLSLNMLPPYFPSYDTMSIATQPDGSISASQIMQINGQSFLLLPITEAMAETQTLANHRLSIQLMQSSLEQSSVLSNKRLTEPNTLQQSNFPTQPPTVTVDQSYSYPLQVGLLPTKPNSEDAIPTGETDRTTEVDSNEVAHPITETGTETPMYLSLEPTYETLEPESRPSSVLQETTNWEENNSIEVFYEPVPNREEQTHETTEDLCPDFREQDVSDDTIPAECQLPIPIPAVDEQEPAITEIEHSAMEVTHTPTELNIPNTLLTLNELNIPNPSPRTITPEPEGRSTPPPSYEEVSQVAIGAYGVAYGTI